MMGSKLADILEEAVPQLIASVEKAAEQPSRRTIERLPGLMRDLVERLRGRPGETSERTELLRQFDITPLVTALRLLKQSIYTLIDERHVPVTPLDVRIIGDWFAAVAESALTAENRRFANMLDAMPDHLMLHHPDGSLIYSNRDKVEVAVDEDIKRVLAGEIITEELVVPHPDGNRWNERHVVPLHGPDGTIEAIATASRDIHARKKAEARLQLLSKLGALAEDMDYERVLEAVAQLSIPEMADWCIIDTYENGELRHTTVSHRDPAKADLARDVLLFPAQLHTQPFAAHVLAGNTQHVPDLKPAMESVDPKFADILREVGARSCLLVPFLVLGKAVALAVFILTPESGRHYDADDIALAEEMARRAGQIIENARLHQQLRQSDARFRRALEDAKVAVVETDLERRIRWLYNTRLDAHDQELIGKTASDVVGAEMGAALDELQSRVLDTGEGARGTVSATRDGKRLHFLIRYEPLRGARGIEGFSGSTVDVTELKEAEEQLARELGFRERMMGILGHDLRNPLSAVLGLVALMRSDDGMSDKTREKLAVLEHSARRMDEMIGTLLDFTRLRVHGSLPVVAEETDLDQLIRGVVAELQAAHRRRQIELDARGNLRGRWDPGRIAQLLSNLAVNALGHGARDSVVRVALTGEAETVILSVTNRGPVIPPELVDRLFEPFQQGIDGASSGRGKLGLGLYIVREIARAHGGTIDVRSADEVTTFAVTLPRTTPPS